MSHGILDEQKLWDELSQEKTWVIKYAHTDDYNMRNTVSQPLKKMFSSWIASHCVKIVHVPKPQHNLWRYGAFLVQVITPMTPSERKKLVRMIYDANFMICKLSECTEAEQKWLLGKK